MKRPTLAQTGAGLVALVAGYASFRHIVHVAREAGEAASVAAVLPFAVDGLILAATAAMAEDKRNSRRPRWSARVALIVGIGATLAANVASAEPSALSRAVAAWPALAFLLAVEVLVRRGKLMPADELPAAEPAPEVAPEPEPQPLPTDDELDELVNGARAITGRGAITARVRFLLDRRPELAEQPARLAELVDGSLRQVQRAITTPTPQELTA